MARGVTVSWNISTHLKTPQSPLRGNLFHLNIKKTSVAPIKQPNSVNLHIV